MYRSMDYKQYSSAVQITISDTFLNDLVRRVLDEVTDQSINAVLLMLLQCKCFIICTVLYC